MNEQLLADLRMIRRLAAQIAEIEADPARAAALEAAVDQTMDESNGALDMDTPTRGVALIDETIARVGRNANG